MSRGGQEGLTLTEVTVVIVLAAVVMTGLIVFYLNAQTLWLDGSTQAITQREVTLAMRTISRRARAASIATIAGSPQVDMHLDLYGLSGMQDDSTFGFWLDHSDSLLHTGYPYAVDISRRDLGPMMQSKVLTFAVSKDDRMVYVDSLTALTPQGNRVTMGTSVTLMNRANP